ncbi:UNKNOWN [Stylonychia lemnae]|uniref:Uncharacterized protein n=1 Tax=Stylonychia lemnae TaxID=5949 RepID=A0A078B0R6_STYLE|nr:UNKNOWN [Stylonychia lemnae]|eukprot:CDW88144.1 UNKNOWN [Stylonychia lemnae]
MDNSEDDFSLNYENSEDDHKSCNQMERVKSSSRVNFSKLRDQKIKKIVEIYKNKGHKKITRLQFPISQQIRKSSRKIKEPKTQRS